MGTGKNEVTLHCSFCGKSQHDVRKLIAGPEVYICDGCVVLCVDIVEGRDSNSIGLQQHETLMTMFEPKEQHNENPGFLSRVQRYFRHVGG